jgi:hypothetical protein
MTCGTDGGAALLPFFDRSDDLTLTHPAGSCDTE